MEELAVTVLTFKRCLTEGFVEGIQRHQRVHVPLSIDPVAGPRIGLRRGDHLGSHGIEFNVNTACEEIGVIFNGKMLEPVFPEVSRP